MTTMKTLLKTGLALGRGAVRQAERPSDAEASACPASASERLFPACGQGRLAEVAALLQAHPALVRAAHPLGGEPLHFAAAAGQTAVAGLLLAYGAAVDARDVGGETALHFAAFNSHAAMADLLLRHGADACARTAHGLTADDAAGRMGYRDLAAQIAGWRA